MKQSISILAAITYMTFSVPAYSQDEDMNSQTNTVEATEVPPEYKKTLEIFNSLSFEKNSIQFSVGTAKLGNNFLFLDKDDANIFLSKIWGNPAGFDGIGMIFPASIHPLSEQAWAIVISYEDSGYISDEDAAEIDYTELLEDMQESSVESNKKRVAEGFEEIELIGWAETPSYDSKSHKLHWAKEFRFGNTKTNTLNYNIRVLGRKGILNLNVVAGIDQLHEIKSRRDEILAAINFKKGLQYEDFNPNTDKIAEYGLTALIAGGVLAKTGVLKSLFAIILAGKKLILIGLFAFCGFIARLFRSKED